MLHWLGIEPSYSRPRVSDDNAYAESVSRRDFADFPYRSLQHRAHEIADDPGRFRIT